MFRKLLLSVAAILMLAGCSSARENVILGSVEGLQPGDRVWLLVPSDSTLSLWSDDWVAADSVTVETPGRFEFRTSLTGQPVRFATTFGGSSPDVKKAGNTYFLEGYGTLTLSGDRDNWGRFRPEGNIYSHPGLQEYFALGDSMENIRQHLSALFGPALMEKDPAALREYEALTLRITEVTRQRIPHLLRFIDEYPGVAYSALLMAEWTDAPDWYREKLAALTPEVQASGAAGLARRRFAALEAQQRPAPEFSGVALDSREISLSDFRGQYVLLDFWGSWCGPCRQSSPYLVALYNRLKQAGAPVEFVGIAYDDEQRWRAAVEEDGLIWPQLNNFDLKESAVEQYGITGYPTTVLISPEGEILLQEHPMNLIPALERRFGLL